MTVWIVEEYGWEGTFMQGIFSSEEKAKAWMATQKYTHDWGIRDYVVDEDH